jgi:predicted Co/Zn/Cd cation transporter (cation efflux family)
MIDTIFTFVKTDTLLALTIWYAVGLIFLTIPILIDDIIKYIKEGREVSYDYGDIMAMVLISIFGFCVAVYVILQRLCKFHEYLKDGKIIIFKEKPKLKEAETSDPLGLKG